MIRRGGAADVAVNVVIGVAMVYLWIRAGVHYALRPNKRLRLH